MELLPFPPAAWVRPLLWPLRRLQSACPELFTNLLHVLAAIADPIIRLFLLRIRCLPADVPGQSARWWSLKGRQPDPRKAILWLPGGAFVARFRKEPAPVCPNQCTHSPDMFTAGVFTARLLPRLTGSVPHVLELRYKLPASPERTLQELREALSWLRAQGFEKVLLAGDSAGGYLALQGLLAEDTPGAVAGMMLCPWLDLALSGKSHHSNAERCFLHPRWLEASRAQFLQGKALASTWLEPSEKLRARPAFLVCSQGDALRDDTFLFAREAERQNLPLQLREVAGFHDSMLVPGFFDASHVQLFEDLAAFTAEHLSDR
ncbi:unnamed protein product [Effrenium voratum]|nr:unnamed protein product [Effrenium voratum]